MIEDKVIYTVEVMRLTNLSRQTIWRFVREKSFPKPSKFGNKNAWYLKDILKWLDEQMNQGTKEQPE